MSPEEQRSGKRILAIKLADLGDVLLTLPALAALRRSLPDARIDILVPPTSASLARMSPVFDEVIVFDKFQFDSRLSLLRLRSYGGVSRLLQLLRSKRYTHLLLLHHLNTRWGVLKHAFLTLAAGAPRRLGLDNGRGWFLTDRVRDRGFGYVHETEYWQELSALAGARPPFERPELAVPAEDRAWAKSFAEAGSFVVVHPGSGGYSVARRWFPHRFASVADALVEDLGVTVVLAGGPEEAGLCGAVAAFMRTRPIIVAGQTSIGRLCALLESAALVVGNDSGVMHLASAMATPAVAIFGPSNHRAWRPYDWGSPPGRCPRGENRYAVVRSALHCSPCLYVGHSMGKREGCETRECLSSISAEEVIETAKRVLDNA